MYGRTDAVESGGGGSPFGGSGGWEVKVWVAEVGPGEGRSPIGDSGGGTCGRTQLSINSNLETANSSCSIHFVFSASVRQRKGTILF